MADVEMFKTPNGTEIAFLPADHEYVVDGCPVPSVTTILQKVGITADLSEIPAEILSRAAEHGTFVHDEIQAFMERDVEGISPEFSHFKASVYPKLGKVSCEAAFATEGYAGRCDMFGWLRNRQYFVMDHKTGTVNLKAVQAQLSMYWYGLLDCGYIKTKKSPLLLIDDLKKDGATIRQVELLSREEIGRILEAYRNGTVYTQQEETMPAELQDKAVEAMRAMLVLKSVDKVVKSFEKELKAWMKSKPECKLVAITDPESGDRLEYYKTAESIKKEFEEKRFAEEHAKLYAQYLVEKSTQMIRSRVVEAVDEEDPRD